MRSRIVVSMDGKELERQLKRAGLTDHDLADATGVDVRLIRRYLWNEVAIGIKNAPRLARALGLSVEEVLYGKGAH